MSLLLIVILAAAVVAVLVAVFSMLGKKGADAPAGLEAFTGSTSAGTETDDLRNLARLIAAEIKMYREKDVEAGFAEGDLYRRLKDDIDRNIEMIVSRHGVGARQVLLRELIAVLARGDASKMGPDFPM